MIFSHKESKGQDSIETEMGTCRVHRWKSKFRFLLAIGFIYVLIEIVYFLKIIRNYPVSLGNGNVVPVIRLEDYDDDAMLRQAERSYPKQILFWTELLEKEGEGLAGFCFRKNRLENCPYKCDFTTDRSYFELSDAVVFDCRHLQLESRTLLGWILDIPKEFVDMPSYRMEHQFWVFVMFESPIHTWIDLKPFNSLFNWTMTFRHDSDVYIPYGRLLPKNSGNSSKSMTNEDFSAIRSNLPMNYLLNRKLIAWVVSNCQYQPSKRDQVAKELQRYVNVDIYGKCGTLQCYKYDGICEDPVKCYEQIGGQYKFYLAFENSLCEDYITEKFFHSLRVRMVPIVYGYGDYSRVAPNGSYIDVRAFPSIKALADYIIYLDNTPEEYLKYFQWTEYYKVKNVSYFEDAWCSLCRKLWKNGNATKKTDNLEEWWLHKSDNKKQSACLNA